MAKLFKKGCKEELSESEKAMLLAGMKVNAPEPKEVKVESGCTGGADFKPIMNADLTSPMTQPDAVKIKIPVAGKAKIIDNAEKIDAAEKALVELAAVKANFNFLQERFDAKVAELKEAKEFASNLQREHDNEKTILSRTIDDLRASLSNASVKASNLEGQLMIMKELTTLTKESAANSMEILYEKIRKAPNQFES